MIPELTVRPPGPSETEAQTSIAQTGQLEGTAVVEKLESESSDVAQQLEAAVARAKTEQTKLSGLPEKYNDNYARLVLIINTYFSSVREFESKYLFSAMSALFSLGKYWGKSPVPASLCVLLAVSEASDLTETRQTNKK